MTSYVFDTTTYSHILRGHQEAARLLAEAQVVLVPHVVIAELRYGFACGSRQQENERLLSRFLASKKVRVIFADYATTDYFVAIAYHARRNGVRLSMHDLWIAALAEQWGATLVTFDNDFRHLCYDPLKLTLLK